MLSYEPGMLVRSLAGHDKGKLYIIIEERDQIASAFGREDPDYGEAQKQKKSCMSS